MSLQENVALVTGGSREVAVAFVWSWPGKAPL